MEIKFLDRLPPVKIRIGYLLQIALIHPDIILYTNLEAVWNIKYHNPG